MYTNFTERDSEFKPSGALLTIILCLMPIAILSRAYALSTLWGMFITKAFDLPPISYALALGLAVTFAMFQPVTAKASQDYLNSLQVARLSDTARKEHEKRVFFEGVVNSIMVPFLAVAVGWTISLFM